MRRRLVDVGRIKRLPSRRTRPQEVPPSNTLLHVKLFCGWSVIVLLDILVGFRLEYLYPAVMFIRSVLDSYKYQGLVFSLLFIVLVIYLDMLCWTMLVGPWLFLIASACVWLEMIRNWDHIFGYVSVLLWMFFLYVEMSQRMHTVSPAVISFSRPFAAHCIGYPVITMSFLIKHHLLHVLRHRQQRQVAIENAQCFSILLKALPIPDDDIEDESDRSSVVALEDVSVDLSKGKSNGKKNNGGVIKGSVASREKSSRNNGRGNNSTNPAPTKRDPSPAETKMSCVINSTATTVSNNNNKSLHTKNDQDSIITYNSVDMCNGDVVRPSSAKQGQPPSGKKQALVKAVPRTDLQQQSEAREKAAKSNEIMFLELKEERQLRSTIEQEFVKQQKEIKRIHADLHASRLQEEEAGQRINILMQQDRLNRLDLQRMRNETDNIQQRLSKMSTAKSRDVESISSLEEQLRSEITTRQRLETQLREQRTQASSQNQWSREEMKEIRDKLNRKEKELTTAKDNLHHLHVKYRDIQTKLNNSKRDNGRTEEKCQQLETSLSEITRVKIELFSYLSEATRKHEGLIEELRKKNNEIESLKQQMQHLVAMQSTWTPSLSPHH